jgi:hypothetical protein
VSKALLGVALLCAGFLAGTWLATDRHSAKVARLLAVNDSLRIAGRVTDSVYTRDTLTLTRVRTRTDSVLLATVDTVIHMDTVRVLVEAEREACNAAVLTCEARVANRDARIAVLDSAIVEARRVPRLSKNLYIASDLSGGIFGGVEARVRLFGLEGFGRYEIRGDSLAGSVRVGALLRF